MKKLSILGSTGSIGTQTLDVVRENADLHITALAAGSNIELLEKQIREFKPQYVAVWDEKKALELKDFIKDTNTKVVSGMDGLIFISTLEEIDIVVTAVVGMIGIRPTVAAIKAGKHIALANKETLVTAGHIIMPLSKENKVNILPVDSEHSAIFQSLNGENPKEIHKILLTASGGPFRGKKINELAKVKLQDALKHPNWAMGRKITIDSSTLVNKGLEVIEAKWLFDTTMDQIQVVVQPQSIIHSMVEFIDGSIMAQLGLPDMKLPIQYALFYPERKSMQNERLDFAKLGGITFEDPDMETFKGLKLAYQAGNIGDSMPTVFNAANEMAVSKFLQEKMRYLDIADTIEMCMSEHKIIKNPTVDQIIEIEQSVYELIESRC
ncbi:1-deoxy-D-xylulose-5-phosphate reductoisomerase [Candidatus Galacturonibacter soehngenii]|uniref:1-deoxy-D-xylulose 5-phosphate reductoisomerase n=1 Tax=Candidatus Galacturonatibacter soehngenii TaxID=2307010 RepID=A0A7V7UBD9_9FIRM|nr:1-deoxy-D-xylulose-5-phosphate reductoisomerase [Candidatus Galacturonibacter soehngenii]KAB1437670.1 1-deoxy-D-xylulose-5-phosphate reductoisomerase [Candidatus Galacturonibacter soehngenii]